MGDIADDHMNEYNMLLTLSALGINSETSEGIGDQEWQDEVNYHKYKIIKAEKKVRDIWISMSKWEKFKYKIGVIFQKFKKKLDKS